MFCTSGKEMGAPTGNGMHDSARELTEMASTQFAFYGLMNPYTYQRPKITLLPNETGLTVPGGTRVAVVPNGTAPALNPPYLPGQYTEYPAAVQGWAQQALPGGGSGIESGSKTDVTTGLGYDAGDTPVRIDGDWTENDMKQALLGHSPRGLGSPDIHHGGQMPGGALHEVLPGQHRNNPALHPNTYNQGVTPEMRMEDRQLHWWYRAREQGADELLPDWIYD